jgi:hypothetical protein
MKGSYRPKRKEMMMNKINIPSFPCLDSQIDVIG